MGGVAPQVERSRARSSGHVEGQVEPRSSGHVEGQVEPRSSGNVEG